MTLERQLAEAANEAILSAPEFKKPCMQVGCRNGTADSSIS